MELCLWPLSATIASAFQGVHDSGYSRCDQNDNPVVFLVLLLSQGQRVPLLELPREDAGTQLAAPVVRGEPPRPSPCMTLSWSRAVGEKDGAQRNANRMCV